MIALNDPTAGIKLRRLPIKQAVSFSVERQGFRACGSNPRDVQREIPIRGKCSRSVGAPRESMGDSLPLVRRVELLQKHLPVLSIDTDEQLGGAVPGQPGLNVDQYAIRETFLMAATMQFAVSPFPKFSSAVTHFIGPSVIGRRKIRDPLSAYTTTVRLSKLCHVPYTVHHLSMGGAHGQPR